MGIRIKNGNSSAAIAKMEEQLMALIEEQAEKSHLWDFDCEISTDVKKNVVHAKLSAMYSLGGFMTFELLCKVSELLQTKSIDLKDEYYSPGCETCDYGSSAEATIVIRNAVF